MAMPRSLDIQQILLQSNAVERVQQVQQQHPIAQQEYFESQLDKRRLLLKEKVKNLEEGEQVIIKEKERESKKQKRPREAKQQRKNEETSDVTNHLSTDDGTGKNLDIKV
ncbi:MAG: hypothetical protein GWP10_16455 [Nitrospiraceae bacterium]|nr:hypothetical protein [Nitrospiraceae bacterium]